MIQTSNPQSTPPSLTLCSRYAQSTVIWQSIIIFLLKKVYSCWKTLYFDRLVDQSWSLGRWAGPVNSALTTHTTSTTSGMRFFVQMRRISTIDGFSHLQYGSHQKFCSSCGIEWMSEALKCFSRFWCSIAIWMFRWIAPFLNLVDRLFWFWMFTEVKYLQHIHRFSNWNMNSKTYKELHYICISIHRGDMRQEKLEH